MARLFSGLGLVCLACALLPLPAARAHDNDVFFDRNLRQAELAFEGEVLGVAYKASEPTERAAAGLPHTFVTFAVERVFKGKVAGKEITLRFMGGAGPEGEFLSVGEHPLFDLGDRDVLFVEGNTRKACPLVRCAESRFRLIADLVYDDDGQEVVLTPDGQVAYGPHHVLREVTTHQVGDVQLGLVDVVLPNEEGALPGQGSPGRHLTAAELREVLAAAVERLHTPEELRRLTPASSADIRQDFSVRPPEPRPFMRPPTPPPPRTTGLFSDRVEEFLVLLNGGDPRLSEDAIRIIESIRLREAEGGVR